MPIPVECASCGHRLKAKDASAGRKIRCPECEEPIKVPSGGGGGRPQRKRPGKKRPEPAEFDENADLDFGALADMERRGDSLGAGDVKPCPECGEPVGKRAEECPHCEADLVAIRAERQKAKRIEKRKQLMADETEGGLSPTAIKVVLLVVIAVIGNFALCTFTGNAAVPIHASPEWFRTALEIPTALFQAPVGHTQDEIDAIIKLLKGEGIEATASRGSDAAEWRVNGPRTKKAAAIKVVKDAIKNGEIQSFNIGEPEEYAQAEENAQAPDSVSSGSAVPDTVSSAKVKRVSLEVGDATITDDEDGISHVKIECNNGLTIEAKRKRNPYDEFGYDIYEPTVNQDYDRLAVMTIARGVIANYLNGEYN